MFLAEYPFKRHPYGFPWTGGVRACAIGRYQTWIVLMQKRIEMFYSTNQSHHWKLNQLEVAISKKIIYNHYITNLCRNKHLIHEELQVFNSIKTHHISSTSTVMKDLYYLFPKLFTFETKSNYYHLVFMGRFKKYCHCNLCLNITNFKRCEILCPRSKWVVFFCVFF